MNKNSFNHTDHTEPQTSSKGSFSSTKNQPAHHSFSRNSHENGQHLILPGLKPCLELIQSEPQKINQLYIREGRSGKEHALLLNTCREHHIRFTFVNNEALNRLCNNVQHQGIAAKLNAVNYTPFEDMLEQAFQAPLPLIIAFDQVLDPGNIGTLVRTLYALGAAGIVVPKHNSAFLGPGAHRSAAGSLEKFPIAEVVNMARSIELAAKSGFTIYGANMHGINVLNSPEHVLQLPAILILGNEEKGIRQGVQRHCQFNLAIPFLREFNSLNVAQAGAILTACFLRSHKYL